MKYLFTVLLCSPCFSITASQRYGRFAVPFRVPLLFSLRMARVIAAENGVLTWTLLTCGII